MRRPTLSSEQRLYFNLPHAAVRGLLLKDAGLLRDTPFYVTDPVEGSGDKKRQRRPDDDESGGCREGSSRKESRRAESSIDTKKHVPDNNQAVSTGDCCSTDVSSVPKEESPAKPLEGATSAPSLNAIGSLGITNTLSAPPAVNREKENNSAGTQPAVVVPEGQAKPCTSTTGGPCNGASGDAPSPHSAPETSPASAPPCGPQAKGMGSSVHPEAAMQQRLSLPAEEQAQVKEGLREENEVTSTGSGRMREQADENAEKGSQQQQQKKKLTDKKEDAVTPRAGHEDSSVPGNLLEGEDAFRGTKRMKEEDVLLSRLFDNISRDKRPLTFSMRDDDGAFYNIEPLPKVMVRRRRALPLSCHFTCESSTRHVNLRHSLRGTRSPVW